MDFHLLYHLYKKWQINYLEIDFQLDLWDKIGFDDRLFVITFSWPNIYANTITRGLNMKIQRFLVIGSSFYKLL
jgi:hypothetical protein